MKISKRQLKKIIKEEYRRVMTESLYLNPDSTGDYYEVIAEEAAYAWEDGIRRIGDFLKIVVPKGIKAGYSKRQVTNDARKAWKLEKEARKEPRYY